MHRLTSEIITSMAAASGSRTNPSRSVCLPKVNHVKFWTAQKPCVCSVGRNATIEIASTTIWPPIASTAAPLRRDFPKLKITIAAANGIAGNSQRLLTIPGFIL